MDWRQYCFSVFGMGLRFSLVNLMELERRIALQPFFVFMVPVSLGGWIMMAAIVQLVSRRFGGLGMVIAVRFCELLPMF